VTTHAIAIEIDDAKLAGYTDEYLAVCWHAAQHNPAEYGDAMAGDLVEHIAREIIRRWLKGVPPELWHHQGRHHPQKWLGEFATYEPGEGYRPGAPFRDEENTRAFHSGRWIAKLSEDDSPGQARS
jgi:hypothetical protein